MNVKQLIKRLEKFPDDAIMVIRDRDTGVDDISSVEQIQVVLNTNEDLFYGGKHSVVTDEPNAVDAVVIN